MTHRYRSGQTVRVRRGPSRGSVAPGDYKVVRLLPESGGELEYRVKSVREAHERVVKESDLERI
jgi:hypothetical protein